MTWWLVGSNAVWIVGLAAIVATLGVAHDATQRSGRRLRQTLGGLRFRSALGCGLAVACLGLCLSSQTWWEIAGWGVLSAGFVVRTVGLWLLRRSKL